SRAGVAGEAGFWLAQPASTRKRLRSRLSRSTVLAPIEPVAPSSVTVRSAVDDRSRAAGNVSDLIDLPHQQTTTWRLEAPARQSDQRGHDAGGHETVQAGHQPAGAGDEGAQGDVNDTAV